MASSRSMRLPLHMWIRWAMSLQAVCIKHCCLCSQLQCSSPSAFLMCWQDASYPEHPYLGTLSGYRHSLGCLPFMSVVCRFSRGVLIVRPQHAEGYLQRWLVHVVMSVCCRPGHN